MTLRGRFAWLSVFLITTPGLAAAAESVTLAAAAGDYSTRMLVSAVKVVELDVVVTVKAEQGSEKWLPAAIVGLSERPDLQDSLQLFLVRDGNSSRVTIGLRMVLGGTEVQSEELGTLAAFGPTTVRLSFREGNATIHVSGGRAVPVVTPFRLAIPYVSVNSCTAQFDWAIRREAGQAPV